MNSTNGRIEEKNSTGSLDGNISRIQYIPNHKYKEKAKHPKSFYTKKQKKRKRRK